MWTLVKAVLAGFEYGPNESPQEECKLVPEISDELVASFELVEDEDIASFKLGTDDEAMACTGVAQAVDLGAFDSLNKGNHSSTTEVETPAIFGHLTNESLSRWCVCLQVLKDVDCHWLCFLIYYGLNCRFKVS